MNPSHLDSRFPAPSNGTYFCPSDLYDYLKIAIKNLRKTHVARGRQITVGLLEAECGCPEHLNLSPTALAWAAKRLGPIYGRHLVTEQG